LPQRQRREGRRAGPHGGASELQQFDQRGERQDDEGRDENVLFENAGMHGDERRRRRGGRRRQGRQLWQHQSCQPDRRKDQHSARECGASAPDFDNELQVAS